MFVWHHDAERSRVAGIATAAALPLQFCSLAAFNRPAPNGRLQFSCAFVHIAQLPTAAATAAAAVAATAADVVAVVVCTGIMESIVLT